jgi:nitrate reductase assembly molybdenum cofactor insertion protein NarJ
MTAAPVPVDGAQTALLQEVAVWRLLGLFFEYPDDAWRTRVAALGDEVTDPRLRAAAASALREASPGMYCSLFGPGGPVSLRAVTYRDGVQLGYLLSEVGAFYDAFAYARSTTESDDHLAVEIGFLAYLRLKQAYALACGEDEHAAVTQDAAERFLADHVSGIAAPVAQALTNLGPCYLTTAAEVLIERAGPAKVIPVIPVADFCGDADEAFGCGGEEGCPAIDAIRGGNPREP